MKLLIGADPEFFLTYNGKHISAVNLIGGSKHNPLFIDEEGNAIQEDNVAVEFNIKPAKTGEEFRSVIKYVLDHLKKKLPSYEFSKESAVSFDPNELKTPQALVFGCEPDYNAWSLKINDKPYSKDNNLRSAGGHVHIGCKIAKKQPIDMIRACDLFLGVPSVQYDPGTLRRELYGMAGSFRQKKYGVEYRSMSNWWIFDDASIQWVFEQTKKAVNFVLNQNQIDIADAYQIQKCINTTDKRIMKDLILKYNLE